MSSDMLHLFTDLEINYISVRISHDDLFIKWSRKLKIISMYSFATSKYKKVSVCSSCPYSIHLFSVIFDVTDPGTKYLLWFIMDATLTEAHVIDVRNGPETFLCIWTCLL